MTFQAFDLPLSGKSEKSEVRVIDEKSKGKRSRREFVSSIITPSPTDAEHVASTLVMLRNDIGGSSSNGGGSTQEIQTKSFKCDVCEKDFATYQALGGHKASHRQKPLSDNAKPSTSAVKIESNTSGKVQIQSVKAHVCPICDKSYDKGQSLGGHMRLHYDGTKGGKTGGGKAVRGGGGKAILSGGVDGVDSNCSVVSSVTPSISQEVGGGSSSGGGASRANDLNLNLAAPAEEDQEIRLDLDLDLGLSLGGNQETDNERRPLMKKPRVSLTLSLDF